MYRKEDRLVASVENLSNYVSGFDIYNSLFLYKLSDPNLKKEYYEVTVYEKRPDLIAKEFYGDTKYLGILMYQVKSGIESLVRGEVLHLVTKGEIDNIIRNL